MILLKDLSQLELEQAIEFMEAWRLSYAYMGIINGKHQLLRTPIQDSPLVSLRSLKDEYTKRFGKTKKPD